MITRTNETTADVYLLDQKYELAIAAYTVEINDNPLDYVAYNNRSVIFYRIGRYDDSMQDVNRLIALNPYAVDAFNKLGDIYFMQEKYKLAIEEYNKAISLDKNNVYAYAHRASCYYNLNQFLDCINSCDMVISLDPGYMKGEAYKKRGCSYVNHKEERVSLIYIDGEEVIQSPWLKLNEINHLQGYKITVKYLGSVTNPSNYEKAIIDLTKYLEFSPNCESGYISRGTCYFHLDNYTLAIKDFKMAIKLNPYNSVAYSKCGISYAKEGNISLAISYLPHIDDDQCEAILENTDLDKKLMLKNRDYYRKLLDSYKISLLDIHILQALNETARTWLTQIWRQIILKKDMNDDPIDAQSITHILPFELWNLISSFLVGFDHDVVATKKIRDAECKSLCNMIIANKTNNLNAEKNHSSLPFFQKKSSVDVAEMESQKDSIARSRYEKRINF